MSTSLQCQAHGTLAFQLRFSRRRAPLRSHPPLLTPKYAASNDATAPPTAVASHDDVRRCFRTDVPTDVLRCRDLDTLRPPMPEPRHQSFRRRYLRQRAPMTLHLRCPSSRDDPVIARLCSSHPGSSLHCCAAITSITRAVPSSFPLSLSVVPTSKPLDCSPLHMADASLGPPFRSTLLSTPPASIS